MPPTPEAWRATLTCPRSIAAASRTDSVLSESGTRVLSRNLSRQLVRIPTKLVPPTPEAWRATLTCPRSIAAAGRTDSVLSESGTRVLSRNLSRQLVRIPTKLVPPTPEAWRATLTCPRSIAAAGRTDSVLSERGTRVLSRNLSQLVRIPTKLVPPTPEAWRATLTCPRSIAAAGRTNSVPSESGTRVLSRNLSRQLVRIPTKLVPPTPEAWRATLTCPRSIAAAGRTDSVLSERGTRVLSRNLSRQLVRIPTKLVPPTPEAWRATLTCPRSIAAAGRTDSVLSESGTRVLSRNLSRQLVRIPTKLVPPTPEAWRATLTCPRSIAAAGRTDSVPSESGTRVLSRNLSRQLVRIPTKPVPPTPEAWRATLTCPRSIAAAGRTDSVPSESGTRVLSRNLSRQLVRIPTKLVPPTPEAWRATLRCPRSIAAAGRTNSVLMRVVRESSLVT